jgi:signal transduction histidine kinase
MTPKRHESALQSLGKPGLAARRFAELVSEEAWAVLGIGLNDVKPLVNQHGEEWRDQLAELAAECLLTVRHTHGTEDDLLFGLSTGTFLVVTQAAQAAEWEHELRPQFREGILAILPSDYVCDGMLHDRSNGLMPIPTLAIGTVTAQDGPFSNARDLLDAVIKARTENERPALTFRLKSATVRKNQLREKVQVAEHARSLLPQIERFAQITTGPIHDLRNGLNILVEQIRQKTDHVSDSTEIAALAMTADYSSLLLETCSEIRFRGVGKAQRTDLSKLLTANQSLWEEKISASITVSAPIEPVEVYTNGFQIAQAVTDLIGWLAHGSSDKIDIVCRGFTDRGRIDVVSDLSAELDEGRLAEQALIELQDQKPWLYVFQKLVRRYDGEIQLQPGRITLLLPKYEWQDIQSTESLMEQIRSSEATIEQLEQRLERLSPDESPEDVAIRDALRLGGPVIRELSHELGVARHEAEKQLREADPGQEPIWASIEAGSHFCQLLTANLLALEREEPLEFHPTDAVQVLESVRRILRPRIEGLAQVDWNVPPNLPLAKATDTTLAQVVLNLALNALDELARLRPWISRLGFRARAVDDSIQIDISDTGGGLPEGIRAWIEGEADRSYEAESGGVGLQVVKSIMDELGGRLSLPREADWATTVRLSVPTWERDA